MRWLMMRASLPAVAAPGAEARSGVEARPDTKIVGPAVEIDPQDKSLLLEMAQRWRERGERGELAERVERKDRDGGGVK